MSGTYQVGIDIGGTFTDEEDSERAQAVSSSKPGIINEWKSGDRRRATCISCNKCLEALRKGEALYCIQQKIGENSRVGIGVLNEGS